MLHALIFASRQIGLWTTHPYWIVIIFEVVDPLHWDYKKLCPKLPNKNYFYNGK